MKILITGSTGFIGQNLIPLLLKANQDFKLLLHCRNSEKAMSLFPNADIIKTDRWNDVEKFNPDVVFHLAALNTSRNDDEIIEPLVSSNIIYGIKLLRMLDCCKNLKLFVNTGSFAEYRLGCGKIDNAYLYSATKTAFRSFIDYFARLGEYKYITVIPYTVYGGKPTAKRVMDYMLDAMDSSEPVDMTPGEQLLDFIHVDDVSSFYIYILKHFDTFLRLEQGEEFHLGTGIGTSLKQVAGMIERQSGKKLHIRWGGCPYRERDVMYAVAPIAKNMELVGWKASINLECGIKMFLENNGKNK